MEDKTLRHLLQRPLQSHKYDYGHVLVIGGSPGMVGAPLMAGMAALRTGSGLVTIASQPAVTDKLEQRVKEIMTLSVPPGDFKVIDKFIRERKVSVVAIGPGLANTPDATSVLSALLAHVSLPIIIDGGGLATLDMPSLQEAVSDDIILTPHAGEFRRLVNDTLPHDHQKLKSQAQAFAKKHGVTLALKGHPTYVAGKDGSVYENPTGNPGMATAGTGDVLTGMIAGLVAQNIQPLEAAKTAVYLHGLAGDIAAKDKTEPGLIAGDVIDAIPAALREAGRGH